MDSDAREPDHPSDSGVTPQDRAAAVAAVVVSRWAIHRRLYDWVLSFAHHKHSTTALAVLSFAESSFFPIPPDVLLGPMCLGHRRKAFWFATVCSIASVLGGVLGYAIGAWGMDLIGNHILDLYDPDRITWVKIEGMYAEWGFLGVLMAAITPIPYKVFTIASGVLDFGFWSFMLASAIGRSFRFFLVAALMWWFGPPIVRTIDRYFNLICVIFMVLLIGGFVALKYVR